MPITHKWDGTILTITSDSGTSSCDLKGEKGDDGARGAQGAPGGTCFEVSQAAYNLLDNSDFRNPINQRGIQSGATVVAYTYCLDRWMNFGATAGTLTISENGISFTMTNFTQRLPETIKTGTVVTAAAKWNDGTIVTVTGTITRGNEWKWFTAANNGHQIGVIDMGNNNEVQFTIIGGSGVVEWAALYEGEYTADTLPAYQPKGYAAELAECKRYYQTMIPTGRNPYLSTIAQRGYSILLEQEMRIAPTITLKDCIEYHEGTWGTTNAVFTSQSAAKGNFIVTADSTINSGERPFAFIAYEVSADL